MYDDNISNHRQLIKLAAISPKFIQFISIYVFSIVFHHQFTHCHCLLGQLFDLPPISLSHQILVGRAVAQWGDWRMAHR